MSNHYNYGVPPSQPPYEEQCSPEGYSPSSGVQYQMPLATTGPQIPVTTATSGYYTMGPTTSTYSDATYIPTIAYPTDQYGQPVPYFAEQQSQLPPSRTSSRESHHYSPTAGSRATHSPHPLPSQHWPQDVHSQPDLGFHHSIAPAPQQECRYCNQMVTLSNNAIRSHIRHCCGGKNFCLAQSCSRPEEFLRFDNLVHHLRNVHGWNVPKTRT